MNLCFFSCENEAINTSQAIGMIKCGKEDEVPVIECVFKNIHFLFSLFSYII